MTSQTIIRYRGLCGEADYPLLKRLIESSDEADGKDTRTSMEDVAAFCAPTPRFEPSRDISIAFQNGDDGQPVYLGFSKLGWYSGFEGARLYFQVSLLAKEFRGSDIWPRMLRYNDERLRSMAALDGGSREGFLQAWSTDSEKDWIATLEGGGYAAVRQFNNMVHRMEKIPDRQLPDGLVLKAARPEHYRQIWEAQKEMNDGLFENVEENWTEDKFPAWAKEASTNSEFWQVAWAGDEVAGMVLAHLDAARNRAEATNRGYTEHIYVRPRWRGRGLASALIVKALRTLKARGIEEAELGVDAQNESSAFALYKSLGYETVSVDSWFRKAL